MQLTITLDRRALRRTTAGTLTAGLVGTAALLACRLWPGLGTVLFALSLLGAGLGLSVLLVLTAYSTPPTRPAAPMVPAPIPEPEPSSEGVVVLDPPPQEAYTAVWNGTSQEWVVYCRCDQVGVVRGGLMEVRVLTRDYVRRHGLAPDAALLVRQVMVNGSRTGPVRRYLVEAR